MRIFITGATGYIGGQLACRLRAEGHEVRALVRPTSDVSGLEEIGAVTVLGDITDRVSMREGMSGADWVIHAAADLDLTGPLERMRRINVAGTDNVASLAYKLGVGRFLSVSSIASFGGSPPDGSRGDEDSPLQRPFPTSYSVTKHEGEEVVQRWARQGLAVNTVYPSLVYGPPGKKKGANALLRLAILGRMPVLIGADRLTSWVYIDDVIEAMMKIVAGTEPGRGYILAGDVAPVGEVIERACRLAGTRPPRLDLPVGLAKVLATAAAPLYRLRGRRPPFTPGQLESLRRHWAFDDSRARRELGWHPRTLEQGLPPTVAMLTAE